MKYNLIRIAACLLVGVVFLITVANIHYNNATFAASQSEGTDQAIEQVMSEYGYNIDAMNTQEPTLIEKVKALFN